MQLARDLGQLSAKDFERGVEAIVLMRDENLERHPPVEGDDYDLHLDKLDPVTQLGLQSYAEACLRPRFAQQPPSWPGLVVGAGGGPCFLPACFLLSRVSRPQGLTD